MFGTSPIELLAADAMLRGEIFCNGFTYSAAWLTGTTSALGANASIDQVIQITTEADFVVQQMHLTAWSAAGTIITTPDFTLNLSIASGRAWFNQAQTVLDICGSFASTQTPNTLPMPRLIPAQSSLTATLANRTGSAINRATLALTGFNVYYQNATRTQVFHVL